MAGRSEVTGLHAAGRRLRLGPVEMHEIDHLALQEWGALAYPVEADIVGVLGQWAETSHTLKGLVPGRFVRDTAPCWVVE